MKPRKEGEAIRAYLEANRESMLAFLSRLVLAESPSTNSKSQEVPLTLLREAFGDLGFTVELHPGHATGGYLLATRAEPAVPDGRDLRQLLLGHCDTVWPIGTLKEMPLIVEENVVRGPGVYDMKGGLTQLIFALRALREIGASLPLTPVVLVNTDEEIGSHESLPAIREQAQAAQRAYILEPALGLSGKLKTARKGVGNFDLVVKGRAAHAGLDPEKGVSAVLALAQVIQELHALSDPQQGVTVNVGRIEGGLRANVIAPECRAEVDVRAPTLADARRIEQAIRNLDPPLPQSSITVTGEFNRPPLERTPANQALWRRAEHAGQGLGLRLEQGTAGGGSDGNFTSQYTATLDGLGAVGDGAHARHEFLYIDRMLERSALLALLLLLPPEQMSATAG